MRKLQPGDIVVADHDGARGSRIDWTFVLRAIARRNGGSIEISASELHETLNAHDEVLVEERVGRDVQLVLRKST